MAGDVVAESLAHLINFTASRQFRVPKPPLTASGKPLAVRRNLFIDSCKPDRKFLQDSENRKDKINTAAIKL